jgi:hypothetical protein
MSYVVVLPSIYQPYTDECVASMAMELRRRTLIVDNTAANIGVSKSWNRGVDFMHERGADWLILLSAAVRFGALGGLDFVHHLREPHHIVEAKPVYGWHLIAFHRHVFDRCGLFDENFHSYFGDIDWSIRIQHAYAPKDPPWDKTTVDLHDMGMAHAIKLAGVDQRPGWQSADENIDYFHAKWGRHPGGWQTPHTHPFNNPDHGLDYWPCSHLVPPQPSR